MSGLFVCSSSDRRGALETFCHSGLDVDVASPGGLGRHKSTPELYKSWIEFES